MATSTVTPAVLAPKVNASTDLARAQSGTTSVAELQRIASKSSDAQAAAIAQERLDARERYSY